MYLYHPHHLYHHDLFEPFDHDLHHDLKSTLSKGQNNAHEDGRPGHSYHIEPVPVQIHQPKSIHHSLVDIPSKYEHHHMSNKIVPDVDQQMKVIVSVHPSLRNLNGVVPDLHNSHHNHYEAVRWTAILEK
jgi:hypothetical protein